MPYTIDSPPAAIKNCPKAMVRMWISIFNDVWDRNQTLPTKEREALSAKSAWGGCTGKGGWKKDDKGDWVHMDSTIKRAEDMPGELRFCPDVELTWADGEREGVPVTEVAFTFTSEKKDSFGTVVSMDFIRKAMPEFMRFANMREMHQLRSPGKWESWEEVTTDSGYQGALVRGYVYDTDARNKVKLGIYPGASIGGKKVKWVNKIIDSVFTPVCVDGVISEISLVDRPSNDDATIVDFSDTNRIIMRIDTADDTIIEEGTINESTSPKEGDMPDEVITDEKPLETPVIVPAVAPEVPKPGLLRRIAEGLGIVPPADFQRRATSYSFNQEIANPLSKIKDAKDTFDDIYYRAVWGYGDPGEPDYVAPLMPVEAIKVMIQAANDMVAYLNGLLPQSTTTEIARAEGAVEAAVVDEAPAAAPETPPDPVVEAAVEGVVEAGTIERVDGKPESRQVVSASITEGSPIPVDPKTQRVKATEDMLQRCFQSKPLTAPSEEGEEDN